MQRFLDAQRPVYERVLQELQAGKKRSHWMWFIFPQLAGLGNSTTARRYSLSSLDEATLFLGHRELGPRLLECSQTVLDANVPSVRAFFGSPDDLKLRSSMTLFPKLWVRTPVPFKMFWISTGTGKKTLRP